MCFDRTGADAGAHAVATNVGIVYVALQSYLSGCVWCNFLKLKEVDHSYFGFRQRQYETNNRIELRNCYSLRFGTKQNN